MNKKEKIEKLEYITMSLEIGNYILLNEAISTGKVFKIPFRGNLEEDMFESNFLYIPKGSSIKVHKHTNDVELYRLIKGTLVVDGKEMNINICFIGESHSIDKVSEDTFIETFKVSKKYLDSLGKDYTDNKVKTLIKSYHRLESELSL